MTLSTSLKALLSICLPFQNEITTFKEPFWAYFTAMFFILLMKIKGKELILPLGLSHNNTLRHKIVSYS